MTDEELIELAKRLGWKGFKWLLTGEGMLAVVEAMRERGWHGVVEWMDAEEAPAFPDEVCMAGWSRDFGDSYLDVDRMAPTAPEAVARAALAALRREEGQA